MSFTKFMRGFIPGAQKATDILTEGIRERGRREYATSVREEDRAWQEKQANVSRDWEHLQSVTDPEEMQNLANHYLATGDGDLHKAAQARAEALVREQRRNLLQGATTLEAVRALGEQFGDDVSEGVTGLLTAKKHGFISDEQKEDDGLAMMLLENPTVEGLEYIMASGSDPKFKNLAKAMHEHTKKERDRQQYLEDFHSIRSIFTMSSDSNREAMLESAAEFWTSVGQPATAATYRQMAQKSGKSFYEYAITQIRMDAYDTLLTSGIAADSNEGRKYIERMVEPYQAKLDAYNAGDPDPSLGGGRPSSPSVDAHPAGDHLRPLITGYLKNIGTSIPNKDAFTSYLKAKDIDNPNDIDMLWSATQEGYNKKNREEIGGVVGAIGEAVGPFVKGVGRQIDVAAGDIKGALVGRNRTMTNPAGLETFTGVPYGEVDIRKTAPGFDPSMLDRLGNRGREGVDTPGSRPYWQARAGAYIGGVNPPKESPDEERLRKLRENSAAKLGL